MRRDGELIMERAVFVAGLDRLPPAERYDRLYLGSEFCVWRLPGEREAQDALAAAAGRGMGFSLVTPFLDEPGLVRALDLVRALPADPSLEVVANDLGLIEALRAAGWEGTLVAGRLLTRQRRGPGFQSFGDVPAAAGAALRGSALDSPAFVELLGATYGVKRFELDDLVQGVSVPDLPAGVSLSLYRPFLLITATRTCPWVFDARTRGGMHGCARPCRGQSLRLMSGAEKAPSAALPSSCLPAAYSSYASESARRAPCIQDLLSIPPVPEETTDERQDPAARNGERALILGGCAQFLEHRSDDPPPAGINRIVWQPEIPA